MTIHTKNLVRLVTISSVLDDDILPRYVISSVREHYENNKMEENKLPKQRLIRVSKWEKNPEF